LVFSQFSLHYFWDFFRGLILTFALNESPKFETCYMVLNWTSWSQN